MYSFLALFVVFCGKNMWNGLTTSWGETLLQNQSHNCFPTRNQKKKKKNHLNLAFSNAATHGLANITLTCNDLPEILRCVWR